MVGSVDQDLAQRAVGLMTEALKARGPDSQGIDCFPQAVLGHRRLAIFDLSAAGHQPMSSPDRAITVVFNGAIFNFPELRSDLRQRGYEFRSDTDTEVLVHGYRAWGIDGLVERLRGMFAIGLWDEPAQCLYLIRDRLGVKPLVWTQANGAIAFASTPRALKAAGFASDLDPAAVAEYIEFGYVPEHLSIYRGLTKVPPASIVEWRSGRLTTRRYWQSPTASARGAVTFDDAVSETERRLLVAVERRLNADVPVGALLSGGIDSSLVCWAIRKLGADLTAFTVATPGHGVDESGDARLTAQELGLRHEVLSLSDDDTPPIDQLIAAYAEPFACESALGMLRVSRAVAGSRTKVLLTGDGGDDVFLGYPRHRHLFLAERIARATPRPAAEVWRAARRSVFSRPRAGAIKRAMHFADYASGGLPAFLDAHAGLPDFKAHGLLGPRLVDVSTELRGMPWSRASARRLLSDYLTHDLQHQFVSEYLTKVDGATMHYALEARSPFLDQDLWEYAAALPVDVRLHGGELKAVLRALARRRIGERVAAGTKRGFSIPVGRWIAAKWRDAVASDLGPDSLLVNGGWVSAAGVQRAFRSPLDETRRQQELWYLWVLERWMRRELGHAMQRAA